MSVLRSILEKSSLLSSFVIKLGNKLDVKNNRFEVGCYHFQKNEVVLKGNNNSLVFKESSYMRHGTVYINGENNCACSGEQTVMSNSALHIEGNENSVTIGPNGCLTNSSVFIRGKGNKVIIGENCRLMETKIHIEGNDSIVQIGNDCSFHGRTPYPNTLFSDEGSRIVIGNDAMLAHGIRIRSTDSHSIVDLEGRRLNYPEPVYVGEHCWIGLDALLLKGTRIPDHCVVAARAVCTKAYEEKNCIYAGNPARIVKREIDWDRKFIDHIKCGDIP